MYTRNNGYIPGVRIIKEKMNEITNEMLIRLLTLDHSLPTAR